MNENNETKINAAVITKMIKQDSVMTELLKKEIPLQIGIPAWVLKEMVSRSDYPVDARKLLGVDGVDCTPGEDFLSRNMDSCGYNFSWGTILEETTDLEDEAIICLRFEFLPYQLLRRFPRSDVLDHFILSAYRNHPLYSDQFEENEGSNPWSVLQLLAFGTQKQVRALRKFILDIFLPFIWPDLLALTDRYVTDLENGIIMPPSNMQFLHPAILEAIGDSSVLFSVLKPPLDNPD